MGEAGGGVGGGSSRIRYSPRVSRDNVLYRLSDDSALFTGDTLFIDYCGYCVAEVMYRTMREVIFPLADTLEVYSCHDYGQEPHALLGTEKRRNSFLAAALGPLAEFKSQIKLL